MQEEVDILHEALSPVGTPDRDSMTQDIPNVPVVLSANDTDVAEEVAAAISAYPSGSTEGEDVVVGVEIAMTMSGQMDEEPNGSVEAEGASSKVAAAQFGWWHRYIPGSLAT